MPHADGDPELLPPIAALFLVVFDKKIGYKLSWHRSIPGTQLEGVVEYKSLPSGLHNVQQDLVYFTHGGNAGLSAFESQKADESDRNAHFLAVGVLVPLSYGRLGRAWLHAEGLRELASLCLKESTDTTRLEDYWQKHGLKTAADDVKTAALQEPSSPLAVKPADSKSKKRRSRALSDAAGFSVREHVLSSDHPALSMPDFLDAFGPIIFPLYRAALLRKRILILGNAPIQRSCNFVYDLSIFSNLPPSLGDSIPAPPSLHRIRPLFNVGIHDIAELESTTSKDPESGEGWIACTTDDILSTKTRLYDVLVRLPTQAGEWPRITASDGTRILATQRDLRRYNALRKELIRLKRPDHESEYRDDPTDDPATSTDILRPPQDDEDTNPLLRSITSLAPPPSTTPPPIENESDLVEPASWASIAYSSFLWWASAGERTLLEEEEIAQDAALVEDLIYSTSAPTTPLTPSTFAKRRGSSTSKRKKRSSSTNLPRLPASTTSLSTDPNDPEAEREDDSLETKQQTSMILIAYFHRLTSLLLSGLGDVINSEDDETVDGQGDDEAQIRLEAEEVRRLGLDVWSEADARFIMDVGWLWWDRDVRWDGRGVECCGVRIC
ncbi:hypothetical protein KVT40_001814 [Elsinoe batatas]|uniref:DUF4484 domain-containing protein n=1 Tax=Elsinoe batatas TaxID=2601811 RepID=A0A8K0PFD7_9PEZI|nr:hypothetical protein KVT40_001814 [Elsinoe batatas]